jgi:hypothetical protein
MGNGEPRLTATSAARSNAALPLDLEIRAEVRLPDAESENDRAMRARTDAA